MKYPTLKSIRRLPRYIDELWGRRQLQAYPELWADLTTAISRSKSTGCTFYELASIFSAIVQSKPTNILELGSGISTIVLAHSVKRLKEAGCPCSLISMEQSEFYYEDLQELIPQKIRGFVELIRSDTEDNEFSGYIGRRYREKPRRRYDFVFIDGPEVPKDPRYFDADILDVSDWNPEPFTAFLDGRAFTRANIARCFPGVSRQYNARHGLTRFDFPRAEMRNSNVADR